MPFGSSKWGGDAIISLIYLPQNQPGFCATESQFQRNSFPEVHMVLLNNKYDWNDVGLFFSGRYIFNISTVSSFETLQVMFF